MNDERDTNEEFHRNYDEKKTTRTTEQKRKTQTPTAAAAAVAVARVCVQTITSNIFGWAMSDVQ